MSRAGRLREDPPAGGQELAGRAATPEQTGTTREWVYTRMTAGIDALIEKYAPDGLTAALSWWGSSGFAPALVVATAGFAPLWDATV